MPRKFNVVAVASAILAGISVADAMPNDADTKPGNVGFCQNYARSTSEFVAGGLQQKRSCMDIGRGVHADHDMHLTRCGYTPRTVVEGAARPIRDLADRCLGVAAAPQGGRVGGGYPAPGNVPSLNSNRAAVIHFANGTGRPLEIHWLDFQGQRRFHRELQTGQGDRPPTFVTHPWIAVDRAGNCVDGVLKASRGGDDPMEIFGDVRN